MNIAEVLKGIEIKIRRRQDLKDELVKLAFENKTLIAEAVTAGALTIAGAILLFKYIRKRVEGNLINRIIFSLYERLGKRTERMVIDEATVGLENDPTITTLQNLAIPEAAVQIAEVLEGHPEGEKIISILEETHQKIIERPGSSTRDDFTLAEKIEITSAMIAAGIGASLRALFNPEEKEE